jgi:MFS transporter, DHA1 family, solute carrier family 18 (vesicular amine transporter), member 1/2
MASESLVARLRKFEWTTVLVVTFAIFTDAYMYGMAGPLMTLSPVRELTDAQLGLCYGGYALGLILSTPFFVMSAARVGRKKSIVLAVVAQVLAVILYLFGGTLATLFEARLLQGVSAAGGWTAGLALIADVSRTDRVRSMGVAMVGSTVGSILGPMLGGLLYNRGGYSLPFFVAFILLLIDLAMLWTLLPSTSGTSQSAEEGGLLTILTDKAVLIAALAVAVAAAGWALPEPIFPNHMAKAGVSPGTIGLLLTSANVVYALCAGPVAWICDRIGVKKAILIGMTGMAATLPLLGLTVDPLMSGLIMAGFSVAYALTLNPTSAELGNAVDRRGLTCYAAAYAVYNIAYAVGMMGSNAISAVVGDKLSFLQMLGLMSAIIVCCIPLLFLDTGELKDARSH